MKILYFFTSHRHQDEIAYNAAFFNKSKFLRQNVENVVCWCNDQTKSEEVLQAHLNNFDCRTNLIMSPVNAGWQLGSLQALAMFSQNFEPYDYVLFASGPDVYVVNDKMLENTLILGQHADV
ncbi:MAG: hypothetical protein ACR2PH_13600, partial [Desulfobulbia bacterium]